MADPERIDAIRTNERGHIERYEFANKFAHGQTVDAGCGLGYGAKMLLDAGADRVIAVDYSNEAIDYAVEHHPGPIYMVADVTKVMVPADVTVCLEAFSHFDVPERFLGNIGSPVLIISQPTIPSREVYPYRLHDFTEDQFRGMLQERGWRVFDELRQRNYITLACRRGDG